VSWINFVVDRLHATDDGERSAGRDAADAWRIPQQCLQVSTNDSAPAAAAACLSADYSAAGARAGYRQLAAGTYCSIQCNHCVGWAAGRASGL